MRLAGLLAAVVVCCALVAGCGGGGGIQVPGALTFTVQWNGNGPGGEVPASVNVKVSQGGTQVAQGVIQKKANDPTDTGEFGNLPAGSYRVVAGACITSDGSGTPFATVQTTIDVKPALPTIFVSSFATTPANASVTPQAPSLAVNSHVQLDATLTDASGFAVYTRASDWKWQSASPTTADMDPNFVGLVDAYAVGTATITATHTPSALVGTDVVTVTQGSATRTKWTILVYLNAANDLDPFSDLNVNQMEFGDSDPQVRVVLQWKRIGSTDPWTGTRRYLVVHDTDPNTINSTVIQNLGNSIDMGDWHTLRQFVDWGMQNYPADHTVLVMWDHGSGWRSRVTGPATRGVSFDDQFGSHISTWELSQAISHNPKIDVIAWDASLMQMIEVAYEIKDAVNFVVGSEESPPGAGYPYDAIVGALSANDSMTPKDFTNVFVTQMVAAYGAGSNVTQSSLDPTKLPSLAAAVSHLADVLITKTQGGTPNFKLLLQNARLNTEHYEIYTDYKDLYDSCTQLMTQTSDTDIIAAAMPVQQAVSAAVLFEAHGNLHALSHGVAIDWEDHTSYQSDAPYYTLQVFGKETHWPAWLNISP